MKHNVYLPEGTFPTLREIGTTADALETAFYAGTLLEGIAVMCDGELNLRVPLGKFVGTIPPDECVWSYSDTPMKEIAAISRVGKPVCFKVKSLNRDANGIPHPILSRKDAMRECYEKYISRLTPGDIIDARITHLEPFGAFADIGCGFISLLPVDCMSVSRISHPRDRFRPGQCIRAVVRSFDRENGRVTLTHRELLGSWEENAAMFSPGQTVAGIVRSVEEYGVFVELAPNLAGLAEPSDRVTPGQTAAVYIKNIIPEKMKIKLVIVDCCDSCRISVKYDYPDATHIEYWRYSPEQCQKLIETDFTNQ